MATILHTSTEQIRAVLGVSAVEVKDSYLIDLDLATLLQLELDSVYPTHAAVVAAGTTGTPTDQQVLSAKHVILLTAYQGAVFLLPQLQMLSAQKISDGDAEMQRFSKDNIVDTKNQIVAMRDYLLGLLNPDSSAPVNFVISPIVLVTPGYDPVTNEGGEA